MAHFIVCSADLRCNTCLECYKFEEAGDVELLFLMEMSEETSFICDLVPLLPGVYNTSTTLPSTRTQIAALVKKNACLSIIQ